MRRFKRLQLTLQRMNDLIPGTWFWEKNSRQWFIVEKQFGDVVTVRSCDTDDRLYLMWFKGEWRRAVLKPDGSFHRVNCRIADFEYRGDRGPPDSMFRTANSAPHVKYFGVTRL